jgi:hypothetical protein
MTKGCSTSSKRSKLAAAKSSMPLDPLRSFQSHGLNPSIQNPSIAKIELIQKKKDLPTRGQKDKNIQQAGFPDGHPL